MDTNAKQELLRKSYTKLYADQNLDALVTCVGKAFKNNLTEKNDWWLQVFTLSMKKEDFRTAESMLDFDMTYSITDMGTFDFLVELIVGEEGLKHLKALKKYDAEDLDYMVTSVVWDLLKFALNESSFSFIDIENKFNTIFSKLFSSLFPSSDPTSFWEPFCKYIDVQLDDIPEKFHEELVGLFIENAGDEDSSSYALVSSAALDFL